MSVPQIGAVVVDVATSRSPDGPEYIKFDDGTVVEVPKDKRVRMVRSTKDKLTFAEYANADHDERKQMDEEAKRIANSPLWDDYKDK